MFMAYDSTPLSSQPDSWCYDCYSCSCTWKGCCYCSSTCTGSDSEDGYGGAIDLVDSTASLYGVQFTLNSATHGNNIHQSGSTLTCVASCAPGMEGSCTSVAPDAMCESFCSTSDTDWYVTDISRPAIVKPHLLHGRPRLLLGFFIVSYSPFRSCLPHLPVLYVEPTRTPMVSPQIFLAPPAPTI
jgi:hypothetical protein